MITSKNFDELLMPHMVLRYKKWIIQLFKKKWFIVLVLPPQENLLRSLNNYFSLWWN